MKIEVEVGKETLEVFELVAALIKDIKEKKGIAEIAAENLPGFYAAINGFDELDDEAKAVGFENTLALGVAKIASAILGK